MWVERPAGGWNLGCAHAPTVARPGFVQGRRCVVLAGWRGPDTRGPATCRERLGAGSWVQPVADERAFWIDSMASLLMTCRVRFL